MLMKKALPLTLVAFLFFTSLATPLTAERDIDPPSYEKNETKEHLFIGITAGQLSADGETDWIRYNFPSGLIYLDPHNVTSNVSISSEPEMIDTDGDRIKDTVVVGINSDRPGNVTARIVLDTAAKFRGYRDFHINTTVRDSRYGNATTVGNYTFEGNTEYYLHEDDHSHDIDFKDAVVRCPEGYICPEIPDPRHYLGELIDSIL